MNSQFIDRGESAKLKSLQDLLQESSQQLDSREVKSILAIIEFVSSLDLPQKSNVVIIGPGRPNNFFWPGISIDGKGYMSNDTNASSAMDVWERVLFDTGAQLNIFEPSLKDSTEWSRINTQLNRMGNFAGQIKVNFGETSFFQNSDLQTKSVDLVLFMNLFGTPMLIGNDPDSNAIISEIDRVLKDGGVIITGDRWAGDREITYERLSKLQKNKVLREIERSGKTRSPWIAYKLTPEEVT